MANRGQRLTQGGIPAAVKSQNYAKKAALALRPNKTAREGDGGGEGYDGGGEGYDGDDDGEAQDPKKPRISDWEHEFWGGLDGSEAEALARANGGSLNDFASTSRDIYPEPLCDPGEASEVRVGMNLITRGPDPGGGHHMENQRPPVNDYGHVTGATYEEIMRVWCDGEYGKGDTQLEMVMASLARDTVDKENENAAASRDLPCDPPPQGEASMGEVGVALISLARLEAVYRVQVGGAAYILAKGSWLKAPTQARIDHFAKPNSILGADIVSSSFSVEDPANLETVFDTREQFVLADQIASQVVIIKHPCMETAVVLDPSADFFEQMLEEETPSILARTTSRQML
ncbi:hypothetical protein CYMTET_26372 [Cymbomonas tetramitiformis]|uniref:Uncharacterized protein n=1 Tax=Cymbomonas tetramitiformis TaxID=36881 RepID=A0AAE0KXZ9_9CHLO|nr:hypothetical protein CYMTET_26372 [Cymbomonas tetramitiformis]